MKELIAMLLLVGILTNVAIASAQEKHVIAGELRLTLDQTSSGVELSSLYNIGSRQELLATRPLPLWEMVLRNVETGEKVNLKADGGWSDVQATEVQSGLELRWQKAEDPSLAGVQVAARVSADIASNALHWTLHVENETTAWSIWETAFPQITLAKLPGGKLFYPMQEGRVIPNPGSNFRFSETYPGGSRLNMQYFATLLLSSGLYVAMQDPKPAVKSLVAESTPGGDGLALTFYHPAPDLTRPGNDFVLSGEGVWQLFHGDWFDAAMIYRRWVEKEASWYPELGEEGREDTPLWMRTLPVWVRMGTPTDLELEPAVQKAEQFAEFMGVPVGLHWYGWHGNPFDNDYPNYFPPKDGFAAGVKELQDAGIFVMPYINSRLWDTRDVGLTDKHFTVEGRSGAVKDATGEVYKETYGQKEADGSKVEFAVMDPSSEVWQKKVHDIVLRLFEEYGVDGVYLDQLGAPAFTRPSGGAPPNRRNLGDPLPLCFDPDHGHPLGGGDWWVDGYREMLEQIRADKPTEGILTGEHTPEMYAAWIDAGLGLHWGGMSGSVPAYPAVYSGAFMKFGRNFLQWEDHQPMVRVKAAQQLVYGEQLGWWPADVVDDLELAKYLRQVIRLRYRLARYVYAGRMERPLVLSGVPNYVSSWVEKSGESRVVTDAVLTGTWSIPGENRLVLIFANPSEEAVTATVAADLKQYGLSGSQVVVKEITAEGTARSFLATLDLQESVTFPPQSVFAWEVTPAGLPQIEVRSPEYGQQVQGALPLDFTVENILDQSISVQVDGAAIYTGNKEPKQGEVAIDTSTLEEGEHQLTVVVEGPQRKVKESVLFFAQKMDIVAPSDGANVRGRLPLVLSLADMPGGRLVVTADGLTLYEAALPASDEPTIDTTLLSDGEHTLIVTAEDDQGRQVSRSLQVIVANWTFISDSLKPPLAGGFFGNIDFSITSAESSGWAYADEPRLLFGDEGRKVRLNDTSEELIWETPALREVAVTVYAQRAEAHKSVVLAISSNGNEWRELNYDYQVEHSGQDGWLRIKLTGLVSESEEANWFRLIFRNFTPADGLQLGHIEFRMRSSETD